MRNGMQAHVVPVGDSYQLVVQGHDSPLLRYPISRQQMQALTDWGTNHANKKAYETFTDIVKEDFDMPRNFVHARNANGRVAMGLHGYRIGIGEYGRVGRYGMPPPFLGWTPRQQEGYHLRRVGGRLFYAGTPMVAERPDGRMKPGEMQSGGYGFYYKGHRQPQEQVQPVRQDVLQDLQAVITPMVNKPRSEEPAKPYKELITSPVYFSNEKWQEILSSHGIIIDESKKSMTVLSKGTTQDFEYNLSEEDFKKFLDGRETVFAKDPTGEGGHGISKITVADVKDSNKLYDELKANGQLLVEEAIVQSDDLNEINPCVVNSWRVVTLYKDGKAHIINNALRINQDESNVIGCTNDLYLSLDADGRIDSNVIDDYGNVYDKHPMTGKKFSEVKIAGVREALDMVVEAAEKIPQVRYIGWDIAFSKNGPVMVEGNEYPGYGLLQFYKLKGKRTGHLKEIADVLGDEMNNIKL